MPLLDNYVKEFADVKLNVAQIFYNLLPFFKQNPKLVQIQSICRQQIRWDLKVEICIMKARKHVRLRRTRES